MVEGLIETIIEAVIGLTGNRSLPKPVRLALAALILVPAIMMFTFGGSMLMLDSHWFLGGGCVLLALLFFCFLLYLCKRIIK